MSKSHPTQSTAETLCRAAESARMRADMIDELVLDALERRAEGIRQKLIEEAGASLTGPDITALKEVRELARQRAERAEEAARQAGSTPDEPRLAQLGFALVSGDLAECWKVLKTLSDERGEWMSVSGNSDHDELLEEMPEGLQEALRAPDKWNRLDAAMLYDLRKAAEQTSPQSEHERGESTISESTPRENPPPTQDER